MNITGSGLANISAGDAVVLLRGTHVQGILGVWGSVDSVIAPPNPRIATAELGLNSMKTAEAEDN